MTNHTKKRVRAHRALPPIYELGAFSVFGFCVAHGLSRSLFYRLRRTGAGPRIMKCGTRTLISVEAAQAWRRTRERAAAASYRAARPSRRDRCRVRVDHRRPARVARH
jgi:hypothetical protein